MAGIFKTTNIITGKIYIGQSILNRSRYYGSGKILKQSILKYGKNNFIKEAIIEGDFNQILLDQLEIHYIRLYNSDNRIIGYNIEPGGSHNKKKLSEYTKNKIRQKALGRKDSEETKLKKSKASLHKDLTKAIENCKLYNIKKSKKVTRYDLNGNILSITSSISETCRVYGLDRSGLTSYLKSNKAKLNIPYKDYIYRISN